MPYKARIIRGEHSLDKPYTVITNEISENRSLSWEARGVLLYVIGKPDNWNIRADDLMQGCGRHKVRRILNELKAKGYVRMVRVRDEKTNRFIGVDYIVYEFPQEEIPLPDFPHAAFPDAAFPRAENRDNLVSTETEASTEKAVSTKKKNLGSPSGERASGGDFQDELQALYDQDLRKPQRDPDDTPKTPGKRKTSSKAPRSPNFQRSISGCSLYLSSLKTAGRPL